MLGILLQLIYCRFISHCHQPLHSVLSFLSSCIQKLPAPHARVTPAFRLITLSRIEPLIQSLHLPLPTPLKISNEVLVPPVTLLHAFLRTCSEHFLHSVICGTAHKNKCFISLRSPCLQTDLATLHSASTLVFADTKTIMNVLKTAIN